MSSSDDAAPARGTFAITMTPGRAELPGAGRFDFTKVWTGEIEGTSSGFMHSAGDPTTGEAGYIAQEHFEGSVRGRVGGFFLHQLGSMVDGEATQRYEIVPGSGSGELTGVTGSLVLDVVDGEHRVTLDHHLD